jgi:hypothetical protein
MCPISEGLTVDGSPVQDAPAAALPEATPAERTETRDPSTDSADAIRRAVADPGTLPTIGDGLRTAPLPESDVERLERAVSDANEVILDSIDPASSELIEELNLGREAREELAVRELHDFINEEGVGDQNLAQFVHELADLRAQVSDGTFESAVFALAEEWYPDDAESRDAFYEFATANAETVAEINRAAELQGQIEELTPLAAEERAKEIKSVVSGWQKSHGYSKADAEARLNAIREAARVDFGLDIDAVGINDPSALGKLLEAEDAALGAVDRATRERLFQQGVLDAPNGSIEDGIERLTPWGWQRINDVHLGPPDQGRIDGLASRRLRGPERAQDIRSSVQAPEGTSVAAGLTGPNGKPISFDEASGGTRRHQQAEAEKLARARALGAQVAS